MKARSYTRAAAAGAFGVVLLGTGVAHAQPDDDPGTPMVPPSLNEWLKVEGPSIFTNPANRGRPVEKNWDGVGMYCQNIFIRCG
ncbi:hypothetical protein BHQ21_07690 [Mycobacterium sherrisii]|uniref:Uncharacterized protein n=1 Tax=Mycobacterium sherrisii TaxID=243061 RepID=A0A1E3T0R0_9MYCO|nr:hypothetical protein [Mycobacterium sherrisii]ODR07940.1 hypothetical protein BHQ21_07690 [Mycobacterium sherrisii]